MPGRRSTQVAFTDGERTAPPDSTTVSGVTSGGRVELVELLDQRACERVAHDHEEGDPFVARSGATDGRVRGGGRGR